MEWIKRKVGPDVLDEKMDGLKRKFQHLESKKEDIEEELKNEVESSSRKRPRKEVKNWIENVPCVKAKVEELEQQVSTSGFLKRQLIEERVDRLTREVTELTGQSKFERGLTLETYDNEGVALLTRRLIGGTFARNKEKILDCLMGTEDDSVVGVYGMGGVGKTTLMTHIYNELRGYRDICVSWVTVSQNFTILKLQHDIAKTVGLDLSGEDDERKRAAMLAEALEKRKRLVLILDDVWDSEHFSLIDVGIENVWKLVLTTRSLTVCRKLHCRSPIKVEPLNEVEAWTLFAETLGDDDLLSHHEIEEFAKRIVNECDGLPLGIVVVAGSMRGIDDVHEWNNALEEIREAKYRSDDMEFYDKVFLVLRYSYDKLKDPKVKECLLYCSLFPEDKLIERDELIEYLIYETLIDGRNSRQSALEKGHTILNKLENVCLLEAPRDSDGIKCVKMHDLVRDMAIKIASDSPHKFLVQAGMRLTDLPDERKWSEDLLRVSLMDNNISHVPSNVSPRCPRLLTLLLQNNDGLKVIPDNFFAHMKMLTILDMSSTEIESLPTSIANLESLTALLLQGCGNLRYVPCLENLTLLRKLDLCGTAIEEVPKGMEKLINLRYLDLDRCWNLKMIPDSLLSQLSKMESFKSDSSLRLRGEEIGSWRKLEIFSGHFPDLSNLNKCVRSWEEKGPTEYTIFVGFNTNDIYKLYDFNKQVVVAENEDTEDKFALPSSTQFLTLESCNGIRSLSHIAPLMKATGLRICRIIDCNILRHVICSCCGNAPFFHCLETLKLEHLPMLTDLVERNMRCLYSPSTSVLPVNSFSSLRRLFIIRCGRLERLFTPTLLPAFQCLQRLEVWNCAELVEIIGERKREDEDQHEEATITAILSALPNLKHLQLSKLPKLKSLCHSSIKVSDTLCTIWIDGCPELKRITLLWDEPLPPTSIEKITVLKEWWDCVEWKHPQTKAVLQPFLNFISF